MNIYINIVKVPESETQFIIDTENHKVSIEDPRLDISFKELNAITNRIKWLQKEELETEK